MKKFVHQSASEGREKRQAALIRGLWKARYADQRLSQRLVRLLQESCQTTLIVIFLLEKSHKNEVVCDVSKLDRSRLGVYS